MSLFTKALNVINSCETLEQLDSAKNYALLVVRRRKSRSIASKNLCTRWYDMLDNNLLLKTFMDYIHTRKKELKLRIGHEIPIV